MFDTPPSWRRKFWCRCRARWMDKARSRSSSASAPIRASCARASASAPGWYRRRSRRAHPRPPERHALARSLPAARIAGLQEFQIPKTYFHVSLCFDDGAIPRLHHQGADAADPHRGRRGRRAEGQPLRRSIFGPEIGAAAGGFLPFDGPRRPLWASVVFAWKAALFYETRFLDTQRRFVAMLERSGGAQDLRATANSIRALCGEHVTILKGLHRPRLSAHAAKRAELNSGRRSSIIGSGDIMDLKRYLEPAESIQGFGGCIAIIEHVLSYWELLHARPPWRACRPRCCAMSWRTSVRSNMFCYTPATTAAEAG